MNRRGIIKLMGAGEGAEPLCGNSSFHTVVIPAQLRRRTCRGPVPKPKRNPVQARIVRVPAFAGMTKREDVFSAFSKLSP